MSLFTKTLLELLIVPAIGGLLMLIPKSSRSHRKLQILNTVLLAVAASLFAYMVVMFVGGGVSHF